MNADEVKQQFQQAVGLFQSQQYEQALAMLDQLDNAVPNNKDIMYFKARVLGVLNRGPEAVAVCDRLTGLGDPRGEQLKAALGAAPAPPPIQPEPDTQPMYQEPMYQEPPQFAAGKKSNKRMNIIGFGLMGVLLLAAVIVVVVRSGGGGEKDSAPPPPPKPPAGHMASAGQGQESAPPPATSQDAEEAKPAAEAASADSPEEPAEEASAPPAGETSSEEDPDQAAGEGAESLPLGAASLEELSGKLEQLSPAEQAKIVTQMEETQLAEFLKKESEKAVAAIAEQMPGDEGKKIAEEMRKQFAATDFTEQARMMKQMMAEADPAMMNQLNALSEAGADAQASEATEAVEEPEETAEPEEGVSSEEAAASSEESADEELPEGLSAEGAEPTEASPETTEEAPAEEESAETAPTAETETGSTASPETEPEEKEEEVKPVFGNKIASILAFPNDETLGELSLRRTGAPAREPWEQVGDARGKVGIPPGQDVKLQMNTNYVEPLAELDPDAIQVLSLWNVKVDDEDLEPIKHLTGLKELDIRRTRISPDGWAELQEALTDCRILY